MDATEGRGPTRNSRSSQSRGKRRKPGWWHSLHTNISLSSNMCRHCINVILPTHTSSSGHWSSCEVETLKTQEGGGFLLASSSADDSNIGRELGVGFALGEPRSSPFYQKVFFGTVYVRYIYIDSMYIFNLDALDMLYHMNSHSTEALE